MYEEMMKCLDEDDMDRFAGIYRAHRFDLTLAQIETIIDRLKIKLAQQNLINQELRQELYKVNKLESQLKNVRDVFKEVSSEDGSN